jgi:hypothetical protein
MCPVVDPALMGIRRRQLENDQRAGHERRRILPRIYCPSIVSPNRLKVSDGGADHRQEYEEHDALASKYPLSRRMGQPFAEDAG